MQTLDAHQKVGKVDFLPTLLINGWIQSIVNTRTFGRERIGSTRVEPDLIKDCTNYHGNWEAEAQYKQNEEEGT